MKKSIVFAMFAALALTACQKELGEPSTLPFEGTDEASWDMTPRAVEWGYDYSFSIESSKAVISSDGDNKFIAWESGDKIGTFAGGVNNYAGAITLGTPCTFTVRTLTKLSAGNKICAYYPYSYAAGTNPDSVKFTIPDRQTTDAAFDADAMPMAAVPYTVAENIAEKTETPVGSMLFRNLGAIICFRLYSNGVVAAGEKIKSVQYYASSDICGQYTADIRNEWPPLSPVSGKQGKVVTSTFSTPVSVPGSKASAVDCYMVVVPTTVSSGYVVVETDGGLYGKKISTELTFSRTSIQPLSLSIATMVKDNVDLSIAEKSFHKGISQSFSVNAGSISSPSIITPAGWTASLSGSTLTVTPPASSASPNVSKGNIVLLGTNSNMGSIPVRMYGINDAVELATFTTNYGSTEDNPPLYPEEMTPYLEDGAIAINADITIPAGSYGWNAYWLKKIKYPLHGNGHTLTIHTSQGWRGGLCQNLLANVQDLTITGTATITGSNTQRMCAGGLACFISKDNLTISNVTSNIYVDVTSGYHNGDYAPYIGGLVGTLNESATKATFSNCHFTGTLSSNESIEAMGGILGSGALGAQITFSNCSSSGTLQCRQYGTKGVGGIAGASGAKLDPGEILTFNNCSFSGIIDYFSGGDWVTRIGGILGNLERGAVLTDCSFTGLIKADMNNKAYFAGDSNNRGIGGLIGRDTAPVDENPNMNAKAILTDCVSNGRITVVRSADTDANNLSHIGHITGLQMNTTESHSETRCIGTNIITVNGSTISPDH